MYQTGKGRESRGLDSQQAPIELTARTNNNHVGHDRVEKHALLVFRGPLNDNQGDHLRSLLEGFFVCRTERHKRDERDVRDAGLSKGVG